MRHHFALLLLALAATSATAASTTYAVDPDHTHPSFEVDHFGGLSIWRGTFKNTSGTVQMDAAARTGAVDIVIDTSTVDFAHDKLNEHVSSSEMLDVAKYPTAEYKGKFVEFRRRRSEDHCRRADPARRDQAPEPHHQFLQMF